MMFSTLTPFFVFKVGVGLLPKWAIGSDPISPFLPPSFLVSGSGRLVCRAFTATFSERDPSGRLRGVVGVVGVDPA